MNTPESFVAALAQTRLPSVFNPYADCCATYDRIDAVRVRTNNLVRYLEAALTACAGTIWIGRDLGYRGGRRTGVPLTDEVHLNRAAVLLGGVPLERATRGPAVAERTATAVWRVLSRIDEPVVLWNIFPLHPHEPNDPLSNRCHTRVEREATWPLLTTLIDMVRPKQMVAIGRDAGLALSAINVPIHVVRHPSYGGQAEFFAGIRALYGVTQNDSDLGEPDTLPFAGIQAASGAAA